MDTTIVAIASPIGTGAVSLIRLSGAHSLEIARRAIGRGSLPLARAAGLRKIRDHAGLVLDEGVMVCFLGPHSYTGEDVVEFTGHGGVAVTKRVLERLIEVGAQPAQPGEFTQRAFMNGRMDLTQAEAVMDLISAQTSLAMRSASEQLEGRLGQIANEMRSVLLGATAQLEAYIDFPEEDINPEVGAALQKVLSNELERVGDLLKTSSQGRILREGVRTVIYGEPNVGKSSLLNHLLGYQRAIVSAREGTTRDVIEEVINIRGIPLRLIDTAGVRESDDEIEKEGIEMTREQLLRADLVLEVKDLGQPFSESKVVVPEGVKTLMVLNKKDLECSSWDGVQGVRISCERGEGFGDLEEAITRLLELDEESWGVHSVAVNARHQSCLLRVQTSLAAAVASMGMCEAPEFTSLSLREALSGIGEIVGMVDTEEILGEIFGRFCIGK